MFSIGDKVVYPMHGAGIIEEIETEKILEKARDYYIMRIPFGDMKVMIPVDNSDKIGVRNIVSEEVVSEVMEELSGPSSEMPDNWNKRYRDNMEKLKSGDIHKVAEVVRNLMRSEKKKGLLSTGERKMLQNARQILTSEIILVKEMTMEEAEEMVAAAVFKE